MIGDCVKIRGIYIPPVEPPIEFESIGGDGCCYILPVFWSDQAGSADYKYQHDYSSWMVFVDKAGSVTISLEKDGQDITTLFDDSLGTYYVGSVNRYNMIGYGYILDWNLVYGAYGDGDYRLKFEQTSVFGATKTEYSFTYCLSEYSDYKADGTIRLDWTSYGEQGWWNHTRADFYNYDFFGQIRLPQASFGVPNDSQNKESFRYVDGQNRIRSKQINEVYSLQIIDTPYYIHEYMQIIVRAAEYVVVNDYNIGNIKKFRDYKAQFESGRTLEETRYMSDRATVTYDMIEYISNKINYR